MSASVGDNGGNGDSSDPVFSPDSRKVAFVSEATDLGPTDSRQGTDSSAHRSHQPVFNPTNSDQLVFTSEGDNLVPGDDDGYVPDLFLRDLVADTTTQLTVRIPGATINGSGSREPAFSGDGGILAFTSGDELVPGFAWHSGSDIYVRDMSTGVITPVSVNLAGDGGGNASSLRPVVSPDGTMVAFDTDATDLVADDVDRDFDVLVRDLVHGTTVLASPEATYHAYLPVFSPDNTRLAFESGLVTIDRDSDGITLAPDPQRPANGITNATFSADGSRMAFSTWESLDPRDASDADVYVVDLASGEAELVSANDIQTGGGNGRSGMLAFDPISFSPDGTAIAFTSDAEDLTTHAVGGGTGATRNVFVARFVAAFDETDLALTSSLSASTVRVGDDLTYTVIVTNEGSKAAEHVIIDFVKPSGLVPRTTTITKGTCTTLSDEWRGRMICEVGVLAPGESVQLTFVGRVVAQEELTRLDGGVIVTLAPTLDPNGDNNRAVTHADVLP